jgi:hypothetical protein
MKWLHFPRLLPVRQKQTDIITVENKYWDVIESNVLFWKAWDIYKYLDTGYSTSDWHSDLLLDPWSVYYYQCVCACVCAHALTCVGANEYKAMADWLHMKSPPAIHLSNEL